MKSQYSVASTTLNFLTEEDVPVRASRTPWADKVTHRVASEGEKFRVVE